MVTVHNLDHESVAKMIQLDLASWTENRKVRLGTFRSTDARVVSPPSKADHRGSTTVKATSFFSSWRASRNLPCSRSTVVQSGPCPQAIWPLFRGVIGTPTTHPKE
jgi:hypothetical protein